MADQEQSHNGQDFTQDVKDGEDVQMNGNGDGQNGQQPPARDDDRYVSKISSEFLKKSAEKL